MEINFHKAEKDFGLTFNNIDFLKQALTHRSFLNEHKNWQKIGHNERLEFLGDAVLEIAVSEYLFRNYPNLQEGELTGIRAALINSDSLLEIANRLDLKNYILVSKGEEKELKKSQPYLLANAVEAIVGALYLDQGIKAAEKFIEKQILVKAPDIIKKRSYKDPKSLFQEKSQKFYGITPSYKIIKSWGPDHNKKFQVGVYLKEKLVASGEGFSKQEAEINAASEALEALEKDRKV